LHQDVKFDLILTNEFEVQNDALVMAPIDNTDHNVVTAEVDCNINKAHSIKKKLL